MKLHIKVKSIYGTPRYFPDCDLSKAITSIRGRNNKTLLLEHINTLSAAGFKFEITDKDGVVTHL